VGEYKVHESFFYFFRGTPTAESLSSVAKALNEPMMGLATPGYYSLSKAVQDLPAVVDTLATADAQDRNYETSLRTLHDGSIGTIASWVQPFLSSDLEAALQRHGMFGYQDFGDLPVDYECARGPLGLKYHAGYGFLLQFLRTGNYFFWEHGENGERHEGDLDVVHTVRDGLRYYWDGAFYGHSYHLECGDENPHRNYGGGNPDIAFGTPGLLLYSYLSGYPWAYEYALEIAETIRWKAQGGCCLGRNNMRAVSNTIRILFEAYRATGDTRFGAPLASLVEEALGNDTFYRADQVSFATYDFLRNVGLYLDYRELIEGHEDADLRQRLVERIRTCRDNTYVRILPDGSTVVISYDDGVSYAVNFQDSDWSRSVADVLALAYRYTGEPNDLALASRLMNTGILRSGIELGCDPEVWGSEMLWRTTSTPPYCSVLHYMQSKETVNILLNGTVYMATKHPADVRGSIVEDLR